MKPLDLKPPTFQESCPACKKDLAGHRLERNLWDGKLVLLCPKPKRNRRPPGDTK